jgi:ParB-like chromosome segregation protein Spo0J
MKIENRKIKTLHPSARNSRLHSEEQVNQIAESIKRFGFRIPIIVGKDGEVIAGNGRLAAARRLKLNEVPCIDASDLDENEIRAFALADNRIAANSTWDEGKLHVELSDLRSKNIDIEHLGFSDDELIAILAEIQKEVGKIEEVEMREPPKLAWALIGLPIEQFADMQHILDTLPKEWKIVTTSTDGDICDAEENG